jgi:hypothetical protein
MTVFTATSNLDYADYIGSTYVTTVNSYCADDNAYWPREIKKTALACPIHARDERLAAIYARA